MLKVKTTIDSVSIFRNGGEVIRKGSAELSAGKQTLELGGLSSSASYNTVRIYSKPGIRCSNIRYKNIEDEDRESEKIKEEIELENRKLEAIELQKSLWETNGDFSSRKDMNIADVENYINQLPDRIEKLEEKRIELSRNISKLQKKLEEQLLKENASVAVVDIFCEEAGVYPIELRYHENNIAWYPIYEIQTDGKKSLELLLKAKISQNTSEDLKDVAVSLITGVPDMSHVLPELHPTYLNIRTEQNIFLANNAVAGSMKMMAARSAVAEEAMEDAAAPVRVSNELAEIKSEETMSEYLLPDRKDIYCDEDTMVDLEKHDIATEFKIIAAARKDPHAYLVATIKTADLPISEAISAGIYLNGIYTNDVYLDPDLSKEETDISLGREEKVFIKNRLVSKKNSNVLLKGQKCCEYVYETTIRNSSDNQITIILKDQIPVSQDKTIVVDKIDLDGFNCDEETGLLNKSVDVAAGQTLKTTLSYKVSWPKDKKISETTKAGRKYCPQCGSVVEGRFCPECGTVVN